MPYIKKERRPELNKDNQLEQIGFSCDNEGELNFVLTSICIGYRENHGTKYATFNQILGALECCKLELYRKKIASYEEEKISENGDVY